LKTRRFSGMGELLDMKTVAKRLGCSKAHVSKLINGKVKGTTVLPTVHLGRSKRVIASTLDEWLRHNEAQGVGK
jgi:excisionase family DNA binding protein